MLSGDAFWVEKRRSHLSEASKQDVPETDWHIHGSIYINDMLVKSVKAGLHVNHLAEAFQVPKDYKMKLNPTKCAFKVSAGKFLGFIVNNHGIEANPDKIRAVLDMRPPSNTKEF